MAFDIPYVNLKAQAAEERAAILKLMDSQLDAAHFVGGAAVAEFEQNMADYTGAKHVVGLNSGTDALYFALKALGVGEGDEVITPPNSFVASTGAIVLAGATPVFADVLADQNIDPAAIKAAITRKTKAIMPVHLTGRIARMDEINAIAKDHGLFVVEDAAQAIGSRYNGQHAGTMGDAGCFSAHPLKNLNAAGDAGYLITDNDALAEYVRLYRNHGLVSREEVAFFGTVSRLDTLQGALLNLRLETLPKVVEKRRANAAFYTIELAGTPLFVPPETKLEFNSYHTFVVQTDKRDALRNYMADHGIETAIHYPVPIHLQPAAKKHGLGGQHFPVTEKQAGEILTLPVHQYLTYDDLKQVCDTVKAFFKQG